MSNFTFLTREQYFFNSDKLDIFKKRGTKAALTDFSILLGAYVSDDLVDNELIEIPIEVISLSKNLSKLKDKVYTK